MQLFINVYLLLIINNLAAEISFKRISMKETQQIKNFLHSIFFEYIYIYIAIFNSLRKNLQKNF